jgi:LysM repeat protein
VKKKVVSALATATIISGAYAGTAFADSYTIQKGDSLSRIASKYHTSILELKKVNHLSTDSIRLGSFIKVPDPAAKSGAKVKATTSSKSKVMVMVEAKASSKSINKAQPKVALKTYLVAKGETLGEIAIRNSMTIADLMQLNQLKSTLIYAGQKLNVTASSSLAGQTKSSSATNPAPSAKVPVKGKTADTAMNSVDSTHYVVKGGDSLGSISLDFGMTVVDLKKLNNLSSNLIFIGQTLKVASAAPVVKTTATASAIIQESKNLMGVPYVWGGNTNQGLDCSGLIYYVQNKAGTPIGRYSADGYYNRSYFVDKPQAGDLVFFENTYKPGISHMGIYLGDNQFIHADEVKGVTIASLNNAYYQEHLDGFKRFY